RLARYVPCHDHLAPGSVFSEVAIRSANLGRESRALLVAVQGLGPRGIPDRLEPEDAPRSSIRLLDGHARPGRSENPVLPAHVCRTTAAVDERAVACSSPALLRLPIRRPALLRSLGDRGSTLGAHPPSSRSLTPTSARASAQRRDPGSQRIQLAYDALLFL